MFPHGLGEVRNKRKVTSSLQAPEWADGSEQLQAKEDRFLAGSRRVTNYFLECREIMHVSGVAEMKYEDRKQHRKEGSFRLRAPRSHSIIEDDRAST